MLAHGSYVNPCPNLFGVGSFSSLDLTKAHRWIFLTLNQQSVNRWHPLDFLDEMAHFAPVSENSSTCTFRPKPNMKWEIQPTFFASTWHSTPSPSTLLLLFHRSTTSLFHSKLGLLVFHLILFLPFGFLRISFPANGFWKFPSFSPILVLRGSSSKSHFNRFWYLLFFFLLEFQRHPSICCSEFEHNSVSRLFLLLGFAVSLQISQNLFFFSIRETPIEVYFSRLRQESLQGSVFACFLGWFPRKKYEFPSK